MKRLLVLAALLFVLPAHAEVAIHWVTVGDPGNAVDTEIIYPAVTYGYGAVGYPYRISKYETTNAQYAEFLNAVAATDANGLYNTYMGSTGPPYYGGITRSGSLGSYTYSAIAGREDMPVNWVSFYDALRFANWLHNGQPTGAQDSTTTEDGAYTMITESYPDGPFITRNGGATVFVPSEDEWYKAAYYDTALDIYYDYPAGTDTQTTCEACGGTPNTANCAEADLTPVGCYWGSPSPNGTFDQGGNLWEWNETLEAVDFGALRGWRGGAFFNYREDLAASKRGVLIPTEEGYITGFRVASWTPPVPSFSPLAVVLLGGLLGGFGFLAVVIAARRRLN